MFDVLTRHCRGVTTRVRRPLLELLEDRLAPAVVVEYTVTQNWGSGFQGQIKLINQDATSVPDWRLQFDFAANLTSVWDAKVTSHVGDRYVVNNAGWNSALPANGMVSFGFVGNPGNLPFAPSNYVLNGVPLGGGGTPSQPALSVADVSSGESGQALFTVKLSQAATGPVTVKYTTSNGTATAGSDYTAANGTLSFTAGQTEKTVAVPITVDTTDEPNETYKLTLSSPTGATLSRAEAVGTIVDDDDPPPAAGDFQFRVTDDWGDGFTGLITGRNSSSAARTSWQVEFDFAGQINSIWNARIVSRVGNHYVVGPESWNTSVAAGASVSFGFTGSPGNVTTGPTNMRWVGSGGGGGGENRAPTAVTDSGTTPRNTPTTFAVLANDTDPDGDILTVQSVTAPAHGTATLQSDGTVRYAPASGYIGVDSFAYTISDGRGGTASATVTVNVIQQASWPAQFYAPYVDATLWPTFDFAAVARTTNLRYFTLAFITADPSNRPAWGGYAQYAVGGSDEFLTQLSSQITAVRSLGGDVMVSFGGAANRELAEVITNVTALKNAYRQVVDAYQLTHIDFDIEGAATADRASVDRRSQAIAALQSDMRAAGRELVVSYTLPVLPTGLTPDGLYVLQSALRYGVQIDGVNIMTMDYGDSAAPNPQGRMGDYAIQAAQSLKSQLGTLYVGSRNDAQLWAMIGVTPMIGMNDVQTEIFDQQEARELVAFAEQVGMNRISMWSLNRDRQHPSGQINYVDLFSSSVVQTPLEFSLIFNTITG